MSQHHLTPEQIESINAVRTAGKIFAETLQKHVPVRPGQTFPTYTGPRDAVENAESVIAAAIGAIALGAD